MVGRFALASVISTRRKLRDKANYRAVKAGTVQGGGGWCRYRSFGDMMDPDVSLRKSA